MLVTVEVWSMNTSRSGPRPNWPSIQLCGWLRTSGWYCLVALTRFDQRQAQFIDAVARLRHGEDLSLPLLDPARALVVTSRLGAKLPRVLLILPADRRRGRDSKANRMMVRFGELEEVYRRCRIQPEIMAIISSAVAKSGVSAHNAKAMQPL